VGWWEGGRRGKEKERSGLLNTMRACALARACGWDRLSRLAVREYICMYMYKYIIICTTAVRGMDGAREGVSTWQREGGWDGEGGRNGVREGGG
jgi:hypothetical protein